MKRLCSVILAALTLGTALTSCGGGSDVPAQTTVSGGETAAATTVAETSIYDTLALKDFGGASIVIGGYGNEETEESLEYFYAKELTGDAVNDALHERNQKVAEVLNIDFKTVLIGSGSKGKSGEDSIARVRQFCTAGDDTYFVYGTKSSYASTFLSEGLLNSWEKVPVIDLDKPWYNERANKVFTVNNRVFNVYGDAMATNLVSPWCMVFNKDVAKEWNVPDLYQIVRDGKWTMDKLYEITSGIYKDANGDGTKDAEDVYGFYTDKWATIDAFMQSHDLYACSKDKNDYPVINELSEKTVNSIDSIYRLYWESPGTYVYTVAAYEHTEKFITGTGLICPIYIEYLYQHFRDMEAEYGVLPYPKLDDGQNEYKTYSLSRYGCYILPKTTVDKRYEIIGYTLETLNAYSHQLLRPAIYDVALNYKGLRDADSFEMMDLILASRVYDYSTCIESVSAFKIVPGKMYRNIIAAKGKDIASWYASNFESSKKVLDELVVTLSQ